MSKNNNDFDAISTPEVINHGVRRLAYGFLFSILAGIILTTPYVEKLKSLIGADNYGKLTIFISLFLPLLVNWGYNRILRKRLQREEAKMEKIISSEFTEDDINNLPPTDRELVKKSLDTKSHCLKALKIIKQNQEGI